MDDHDGLGFGRDQLLDQAFIHIRVIRMAVHKDDFGAPQHKGVGGGHKRKTGHNDLIPCLYIEQDGRHLQGIGTGGGQQTLLESIPLFEEGLAAFGKLTIAGNLAQFHRLPDILQFLAGHVGFVEGDHGVGIRKEGIEKREKGMGNRDFLVSEKWTWLN